MRFIAFGFVEDGIKLILIFGAIELIHSLDMSIEEE